MAAIVRVKRSRVEEPAESLFLLCKRIKLEGADEDEEVKSVFKFAGTVNAKANEAATQCVQQAIRKEKLTKEYKLHTVDWEAKRKEERTRMTKTGRCKIVAKKRSQNFQGLQDDDASDVPVDSEKQFLLYDVEKENKAQPKTQSRRAVADEVACNGSPMVRAKVKPPPPPVSQTLSSDDIDFVYDLYYMNSAKFDYRMLENVLAVELVKEEFVSEGVKEEYEEGFVDPDDDENAEDNWRNDYPDEDPLYYETMDTEYAYGEDGRFLGDKFNSDFERCLKFEPRDTSEDEKEEENGANDDFHFVEVLGTGGVEQMGDMSIEKFKSLHDSYKLKLNSS